MCVLSLGSSRLSRRHETDRSPPVCFRLGEADECMSGEVAVAHGNGDWSNQPHTKACGSLDERGTEPKEQGASERGCLSWHGEPLSGSGKGKVFADREPTCRGHARLEKL